MRLLLVLALLPALTIAMPALAQHDQHAGHMASMQNAPLTDGLIKKVDKAAGELVIQHGPLDSIGMPPMTMAFGVGTWVFAPLKFQADMGVLLVFMFLVNVVGAMLLLPALAYWLDLWSVAQTRATRPQPLTTPA